MASIPKIRVGQRAILAFVFVFWFVSLSFSSKAVASCGDYLRHSGVSGSSQVSEKLGPVSDNSAIPSTRCKNGSCRGVPVTPPTEPSRVVVLRQHPNHLRLSCFTHVCVLTGFMTALDDCMPIEPSLDLPDPPPRAAAL